MKRKTKTEMGERFGGCGRGENESEGYGEQKENKF